MSKYKELKFFKGWTLENFPFIEDDFDAITTYQFMCKLVEYLNKVIYNQLIVEENNEKAMQELAELKAYVDQYLVDVDDIKAQILTIISDLQTLGDAIATNKANITALNIKIDNEISSLRAELIDLINDNFNTLRTYVDYQDSILDEKINNIQIGAIKVYNPTTGTLDPLQTVINDLYEITNKDGLTAGEFDALELTATGFDAYQITAKQFDSEGKIILT